MVIVGLEVGLGRGSTAVYHCDMGWKMKLDLWLEMWTSDLSLCFERELVIRAMPVIP